MQARFGGEMLTLGDDGGGKISDEEWWNAEGAADGGATRPVPPNPRPLAVIPA